MSNTQDTIQQIREFNRFYTTQIGLLNRNYLETGYSVTENRLLYELYSRPQINANQLTAILQLDKGYISRMIGNFEKKGLLSRIPSEEDRRIAHIQLTEQGRKEAERLIAVSNQMIQEMIQHLDSNTCNDLCSAMQFITTTLRGKEPANDYEH